MESIPGRSTSSDSLKARVVTKAFGLRIGAFGVDYTSKSVEVDPEQLHTAPTTSDSRQAGASPGASRPDLRDQAFQAAMAQETLRQQVYAADSWQTQQTGQTAQEGATVAKDTTDQADSAQVSSSHPDPVWRRGLAAYAQARDILRSDAQRLASTRLAVA